MRAIDADAINPIRCPQSIEEMRRWIDEQPTVKAEPTWIPVEEKLPKPDEAVLVTYDWEMIGIRCISVSHYDHEGKWQVEGLLSVKVIAWMPLPKPYERKEE